MIILASASPRRKELLKLITDDFIIEPADIDETVTENIELEKYPEYIATKKAAHIAENGHINDIVIGCDTGVFINGKMLGKPQSEKEAAAMLKELSSNTHKVITGCCIICKGKKHSFSQTTMVEFENLTNSEIDAYIATGEPMDKAGAYGIQGKGALFVKSISGNYFNVVGLPVSALYNELKQIINKK